MAKAKFEFVDEESAQKKEETTAVAVKEQTAVSTGVEVKGLNVRFATIAPFYSVSSIPQECARECREGDLVIKESKNSAYRVSCGGKEGALRAIVVDGKPGYLERRPMNTGVPRAWVVGRPKTAGSAEVLKTLEDCRQAAAEELAKDGGNVPFYRFEDYSKATNPIPAHCVSECLYLEMLVRLPEDFMGDLTLVKVGDSLYTPVRALFKGFDPIKVKKFFNNIQVREQMKHRGEKGWAWSPYGQFVSFYAQGSEFTRPTGGKGMLWTPTVEAALNDEGRLYVASEEERQDLVKFCMAATSTTATAEEVAAAGQDGEL